MSDTPATTPALSPETKSPASAAGAPGKVFVTGAPGYVGRHVVACLAKAGHAVRALVRPTSDRGPITGHAKEFHEGSITDPASMKGACEGCFAAVHLVGIIHQGEDTYEHVHVEGTRNVLAEAKAAGVKRFVYLSAIGARPDAVAGYHKTKYAAEQMVNSSGLEGYNFQPSIIFGPEDEFVNLFVKFARNIINPLYPPWPIMPAIGGGGSYLQPVWVEDVAEAVTRAGAADFPQKFPPGTYQLGGPEALTVKQIMRIACRAAGRDRIFVPVPIAVAKILAMLMEKFSRKPLLTTDQVIMLQEDGRAHNNKAAEILGRPPRRLWDYAQDQFHIDVTLPH